MSEPKHPEVKVRMVGEDGNAFAILGRVSKALKRAGHHQSAEQFVKEATSGDYDHLLATCFNYVDVDGDDLDEPDDLHRAYSE